MKSLKTQLLAWFLSPLIGLLLVNAWTAYRNAYDTAGSLTDHLLLASARAIAEQIKLGEGGVEATIPPVALEMLATDEKDHVVYSIVGPNGMLLAGNSDLAATARTPDGLEPLYWNEIHKAREIRVVGVRQPLASEEPSQVAFVVVGETLKSYHRIAGNIWRHDVLEQAFLVAIACGLAWFSQRRALMPLVQLRDTLNDRDAGQLDPLPTKGLQTELQPVALALNGTFQRLGLQIKAQRRFIADAAHQLRTPLALLKTQASVGRREGDLLAAREAFDAIIVTTDDMTRLVNQLMTLARTEADHVQPLDAAINLIAFCQSIIDQYTPLARANNVELFFRSNIKIANITGDTSLLRELFVNLLDNALKYTPGGGSVFVSVESRDDAVILHVEDTGIGIPVEEQVRVFERFYRVLGTGVEGSGLGLSIVAEVARLHRADLSLQNRDGTQGLSVEVRFGKPMLFR